jgi:hypothetical protein
MLFPLGFMGHTQSKEVEYANSLFCRPTTVNRLRAARYAAGGI